MNREKRIVLVISLTLSLAVMGSCVSKKDYLLKVEEGEKFSRELAALRSEYARVQGMKEALDKQVVKGRSPDSRRTPRSWRRFCGLRRIP
jgi:hypothetical protein